MNLSPQSLELWNRHGLIATNDTVTLSLTVLERLLGDARRQGIALASQALPQAPEFGRAARTEAAPVSIAS